MASVVAGRRGLFLVVAASRPPIHNVHRPTKRASQAAKHMQFRFIAANGAGHIEAVLGGVTARPGGVLWT